MPKSHRDHLLYDAPDNVAAVNAMLIGTATVHDPEYAAALENEPSDEEPVTCVYSVHDVAWEWLDLEEIDFAYEDAKQEHLAECVECREESDCVCAKWEEINDHFECGPGGRAYADAPWVLGDDGKWDAPGCTIMLIENETTVQLVKSPETWRRGWCSPCYPGQCDADAEGDVLCFRLPNEYLRGDE